MPPPARPPSADALLDALASGEDGRGASPPRGAGSPRDALRRDLARLLGTRPRHRPVPAHLGELRTSSLTYGLADLRTRALADDAGREALRAEIEAQIGRFEPRLAGATVEGAEIDGGRRLRFRIRAALRPGGETVAFDADLDAAARTFAVADAPAEDEEQR